MRVSDLVRVVRTCSVRGAVNHESKERNDRYTFAGSGLVNKTFFVGVSVTDAISFPVLEKKSLEQEDTKKTNMINIIFEVSFFMIGTIMIMIIICQQVWFI